MKLQDITRTIKITGSIAISFGNTYGIELFNSTQSGFFTKEGYTAFFDEIFDVPKAL